MQYGLGKLSSTQFGQALKETAHEIHRDIRAIERTLCKNYSSVRFVSRLGRTGRKLAQWRIDGRLFGKNKLAAGRKMVDNSPDFKGLKELEKRAQELGQDKVKKFIKACNDPNISEKELRELVLAIQCDRWAKNYMNTANVIDKYRFRFTMENKILHEGVKKALKTKLARKFDCSEADITFFEATGNATKVNAVNCKKVGMDHDYTIRVRGKDLPEEVASRYWNDEYCYQATGSNMYSPWDADKLGLQAEQTAVSYKGPESFRTDIEKVTHPKETADQPGRADTQDQAGAGPVRAVHGGRDPRHGSCLEKHEDGSSHEAPPRSHPPVPEGRGPHPRGQTGDARGLGEARQTGCRQDPRRLSAPGTC